MIRRLPAILGDRKGRGRPLDAAIIGMACQYPGAPDLERFLEAELSHKPGTEEQVSRRSKSKVHRYQTDLIRSAAIQVSMGALDLEDPNGSALFQIIQAALADAGFATDLPHGCKIEVVIGRGIPVQTEAAEATFAVASRARLNAVFRYKTQDTHRSFDDVTIFDGQGAVSLLALEIGARSLRERRADLLILGEIETQANADRLIEGVGIIVLKRLEDAERDEDRVYAVLKGLATTSMGQARGRELSQRTAFRRAGIEPGTERLIENRPTSPIRGLIKAAVALHHRILPVQRFTDRKESPGNIQPTPSVASFRPWFQGETQSPRRAMVSATATRGIGGHAVLEGHASSFRTDAPGVLRRWDSEAILLGAADRENWLEIAGSLVDWLRNASEIPLQNVAYTLNTGQPAFPFRVGFVASTIDDLRTKIEWAIERIHESSCASIRDARGIYFWEQPLASEGSLAFLFPGEGSQYPGMLSDLCPHFPEVSALFDTADRVARERGHARAPSDPLGSSLESSDAALWSIGTAINIVLTSQWALYQVLIRLGLRPAAVVGHSSGEFLALGASGVLRIDRQFEDGIGALGAVFEALDASGQIPTAALLAIAADRDRVREIVSDLPDLTIAIDNCPHQVVLAGPEAEIERASGRLRAAKLFHERLPFDRAYHTSRFASAIAPVRVFLESLPFRSPRVRLYSCSIASQMPANGDRIRDLAAEQWARPVAFRDTIEAMYRDGVRLFVEVGARGNLTGFTEDILRDRRSFAVAANLPKRSGLLQLNHLVASLFAHGVAIKTDHLYARRRPEKLRFDLDPAARASAQFPFADQLPNRIQNRLPGRIRARETPISARDDPNSGIVEPPASKIDDPAFASYQKTMKDFLETQKAVMSAYQDAMIARNARGFAAVSPWLGEVVAIRPGIELIARRRLGIEGDPVARNHTLGGRRISASRPDLRGLPVVPFTVNAETIAQAASLLRPDRVVIRLEGLRASRWIRYEENASITLETVARRDDRQDDLVHVQIFNLGVDDRERTLVFEGSVRFGERRPLATRATPRPLEDAGPCRFTSQELYDDQWLFHGPAMRALCRVGVSSPGGIEGAITVLPRRNLISETDPEVSITDAIVLDTFTHLLGCWGLDQLIEGDVLFPLRLGRLEILGDDPAPGTEVDCRIEVTEIDPRRVRVNAEFARADGTIWMRLNDWEDWRFHWPSRYRDVFRAPDQVLLGERLALPGLPQGAVAVWLEPPDDFGKPIWRDVLEWVELDPLERKRHLEQGGDEPSRSLRLWGIIAAKEAARRLWLDQGADSVYPADLEIEFESTGSPRIHGKGDFPHAEWPRVSMAMAPGVAVALASLNPQVALGLAVARIGSKDAEFNNCLVSESSQRLLDRVSRLDTDQGHARIWAAVTAACRAWGFGVDHDPPVLEIMDFDVSSSLFSLRHPDRGELRVATDRRGESVWAWALAESNE